MYYWLSGLHPYDICQWDSLRLICIWLLKTLTVMGKKKVFVCTKDRCGSQQQWPNRRMLLSISTALKAEEKVKNWPPCYNLPQVTQSLYMFLILAANASWKSVSQVV